MAQTGDPGADVWSGTGRRQKCQIKESIPRRSRAGPAVSSVTPRVAGGCISVAVPSAATSGAATTHPLSMRQPMRTARTTRSSRASSPAKIGSTTTAPMSSSPGRRWHLPLITRSNSPSQALGDGSQRIGRGDSTNQSCSAAPSRRCNRWTQAPSWPFEVPIGRYAKIALAVCDTPTSSLPSPCH
jgi:hypothetical protein